MSTATETRPAAPAKAPPLLTATVTAADLLGALTRAERHFPTRRSPILIARHALLTGSRGTLTVRVAGDRGDYVESIAAPGATGTALADRARLTERLRVLGRRVDVTVRTPEPSTLTITAGTPEGMVTYHDPTMPVEDFPSGRGSATSPEHLVLTAADARALSAAVARGASGDPALPVLQAIRLRADHDTRQVVAVTTDRYRLHEHTAPLAAPPTLADGRPDVLVPAAQYARFVAGMGAAYTGRVTIYRDGNDQADVVILAAAGRRLTLHLDDAPTSYPKVDSLWPTDPPVVVTAPHADTVAVGVARAAAGGMRGGPVKVTAAGGVVSLETDGSRATLTGATAAAEEIGPLALNPGYLRDTLAVFGDAPVTLSQARPGRPVVVASVDRPQTRVLLMPMRVE